MGIRFYCPNGCKLHVKAFQAGKRGICPHCGCSVDIPLQSTRPSSKKKPSASPKVNEFSQEGQVEKAGGQVSSFGGYGDGAAVPRKKGLRPVPEPLGMEPPPLPSLASEAAPVQGTGELLPAGSLHSPAAIPLNVPSSPSPSTSDPFGESPNATWYVSPPSGGQFGPATNEVMRTWLAEGRIPPESMVWRDGWTDWKTARDVFPAKMYPTIESPDTLLGPDPYPPRDDFLAPTVLQAPHPTPSTAAQVLVLLAVIALGGGVLAAVYIWARFF